MLCKIFDDSYWILLKNILEGNLLETSNIMLISFKVVTILRFCEMTILLTNAKQLNHQYLPTNATNHNYFVANSHI